jgi:hypothetical protein
MAQRLDRAASSCPPLRCLPVQMPGHGRSLALEVGGQVGTQQLLDPELGAMWPVRGDQSGGPFQGTEQIGSVGPPGQLRRERTGDRVTDARPSEQVDLLGRDVREDLAGQVVGHGAVVPGEVGQEVVGCRVSAQRHGSEPDSGDPPVGAGVQQGRLLVIEEQPAEPGESGCLLDRERQLLGAQLVQPLLHAEPRDRQAGVEPARHHEPDVGQTVAHEDVQTLQHVLAAEVVGVIEHEPHPRGQSGEGVEHVGHEIRTHRRPWHDEGVQGIRRLQCRAGREGGQHRVPEPSGIVVLLVQGHPGARDVLPADPVGQEQRLAVAGGRADERERTVLALVQGGQQCRTVHELCWKAGNSRLGP